MSDEKWVTMVLRSLHPPRLSMNARLSDVFDDADDNRISAAPKYELVRKKSSCVGERVQLATGCANE